MSGKNVTALSDDEILEAVREEVGKGLTEEERSQLKFRMDSSSRDSIAVVVNFNGPDGIIIIDGVWLTTGENKLEDGRYLYISSDTFIAGEEQPAVDYVHRE